MHKNWRLRFHFWIYWNKGKRRLRNISKTQSIQNYPSYRNTTQTTTSKNGNLKHNIICLNQLKDKHLLPSKFKVWCFTNWTQHYLSLNPYKATTFAYILRIRKLTRQLNFRMLAMLLLLSCRLVNIHRCFRFNIDYLNFYVTSDLTSYSSTRWA